MSEVVIQAENLGKRFRIGAVRPGQRTFRELLSDAARGPFIKIARVLRGEAASEGASDHIWALRDISFEINRGEVVGVIGRNGAGKSTLLKILSRITEPTEGRAEIRGRVGSLLEVGTGFHPELSGRENVYLNGAILGMRRVEINKKFDEIVAFAEVEKFIDTPVKHYSSGMYVRLAFAVAAHLETEILLVDEVLAVGDIGFQKKCLGKMDDVAHQGRTVLFVSHNVGAIQQLCGRALLLGGGNLIAAGPTETVVRDYWNSIHSASGVSVADRTDRQGNGALRFLSLRLMDSDGRAMSHAASGQDVTFAIEYACNRPLRDVNFAISLRNQLDIRLCNLTTRNMGDFATLPERGTILCRIPRLPLNQGRYSVNIFAQAGPEVADWVQEAYVLDVQPGAFFASGYVADVQQGPILMDYSWSAS